MPKTSLPVIRKCNVNKYLIIAKNIIKSETKTVTNRIWFKESGITKLCYYLQYPKLLKIHNFLIHQVHTPSHVGCLTCITRGVESEAGGKLAWW